MPPMPAWYSREQTANSPQYPGQAVICGCNGVRCTAVQRHLGKQGGCAAMGRTPLPAFKALPQWLVAGQPPAASRAVLQQWAAHHRWRFSVSWRSLWTC